MDYNKEYLGLNQFSERTFDYLSIHFPEILENASSEISNSGERFLSIEKKCPNPNVEYGLYFNSEDDAFTVGFDSYHCHLFRFSGLDFEVELNRAIQIIKDILNNELFILKCLDLSSRLIEKNELNSLNNMIEEGTLKSKDQGKIISWDGHYDQEIKRKNESLTMYKNNGGDICKKEDTENTNLWFKIKKLWS